MATVVIIHAAEDTLPARALAEKVRQAKVSVQLEMPPGEDLRNAVRNANVVLALWSPRSVQQPALIEEAARASDLIHIRMQNSLIPEQFRTARSVDLTGWRGEDEFPAWRDLAAAVTAKLGVPNIPPPAPRPAAAFFQPGSAHTPTPPSPSGAPARAEPAAPASPPPARAASPASEQPAASEPRFVRPRTFDDPEPIEPKGASGGMALIIGLGALVVLGGGGFFVWNMMQSQHAAQVWSEVDKTNADALRRYMSANPTLHHDEAQRVLDGLEAESFAAAQREDSIAAYEGFLREYPQSTHMLEARGRIAELRNQQAAAQMATLTSTSTDTTTTDTTANPDLLPPNATNGATTTSEPTRPDNGGPVQLTPPAPPATTTSQ